MLLLALGVLLGTFGKLESPSYVLEFLAAGLFFLCLWIFTLGLVYATSAIVVFFRDLTQIIGVFLQIGVWMTPIMWDINMLAGHPFLMRIFKFNPIYYIVTGYRDSILGGVGIWHHWKWGVYFWVITAFLFVFGSVVFKKLKVHFADVL